MSANSSIEWTDATWNPLRGCSRVSPGCDHCYAMREARRHDHAGGSYEGLTRIHPRGVDWSGKVIESPDHVLLQPLGWRTKKKIFVNSMSDLFHPSVPWEWVDRVFAVMALAPRHTFQVLTKRPQRMRAYLTTGNRSELIARAITTLPLRKNPHTWETARSVIFGIKLDERPPASRWPLPNVWLGVSCEDQQRYDDRIDHLLNTPAAVRFLSLEPLIGPIDLSFEDIGSETNGPDGWVGGLLPNWVIVGGESGHGARPCAVEWIERIIEQCAAAGVMPFVKQLGSYVVSESRTMPAADCSKPPQAHELAPSGEAWAWRAGLKDRKGGDPAEWPDDLRIREFPRVAVPA